MDAGEDDGRRRDDTDMNQPGLKAEIEEVIELPALGMKIVPEPLKCSHTPLPRFRPHTPSLSRCGGGAMSRADA